MFRLFRKRTDLLGGNIEQMAQTWCRIRESKPEIWPLIDQDYFGGCVFPDQVERGKRPADACADNSDYLGWFSRLHHDSTISRLRFQRNSLILMRYKQTSTTLYPISITAWTWWFFRARLDFVKEKHDEQH